MTCRLKMISAKSKVINGIWRTRHERRREVWNMKFETRNFTYVKADGSRSTREVFVIAEDANYVQGIDLGHVSSAERNAVTSMAGDIQNVTGRNVRTPDGFKKEWNSAWRLFKKSNIQ